MACRKLDGRATRMVKKLSMLRKRWLLIWTATFLAATNIPLLLFASSLRASEPRRGQIVAEIRAVIQAQQEAWNRGDIDAFMNGYARSRSTIFISEDKVTRGWQTVRDRYHKKYSDREKMGTLNFSELEITPLGADSAVVLGRWQLKRKIDMPHGRFTLIFRKTADGWRIVHDHTSAAK
jgi:ketosteroid isomerase-like protein